MEPAQAVLSGKSRVALEAGHSFFPHVPLQSLAGAGRRRLLKNGSMGSPVATGIASWPGQGEAFPTRPPAGSCLCSSGLPLPPSCAPL